MAFTATLAASTSTAQGYVYWAEFGGGNGNQIWRANLDGSVKLSIVGNAKAPCGVAVDAQHIYWGNAGGASIGRAKLDGSDLESNFISLPPGSASCGVAVNGSQIWWVGLANGQPDPNASWIGHANIDGTGVVQRIFNYPQVGLPCRLAVNASFVYWVNNFNGHSIWRAGLDGTPPPAELISDAAPAGGSACSPTLSGSRLYWWSYPQPGIVSSDLDGNDRRVEIGLPAAGGIALLDGQIYWASGLEHTISRASLGGTQPEFGFIHADQPNGLAVDSGVPSNSFSFGKLRRNKEKGTASLVVKVPAPGRISMRGRGVIRQRPERASDALDRKVPAGVRAVKLRIKAKGRKGLVLDNTGQAVLRLRFTFSPTGGTPSSKRKRVTLIER